MPQYRNPFEKGDLYIKFDVQFPENNWVSPDKLSVSAPGGRLRPCQLGLSVTFHCLVPRGGQHIKVLFKYLLGGSPGCC